MRLSCVRYYPPTTDDRRPTIFSPSGCCHHEISEGPNRVHPIS